MLSARGVSRASAILPSFHLKQFITFTNPVLIHKFLQCEILQRMLHRKTAFSGLTLVMEASVRGGRIEKASLRLRRFDFKYGLDHDRCADRRAVHTVHHADVSHLGAEKLDKEFRGAVGDGGVLDEFLRR